MGIGRLNNEAELLAFIRQELGVPQNLQGMLVGYFLKLTAAGDHKVNFGSDTWSSTAANNGATTITHGLGTTPVAMFCTASDGLVVMAVDTVGATTFRAWFRYADGVARTASGPFYWLAVS